MKLFVTSLLGLALAGTAVAQGPGRGEVEIKDATVNGSGCPVGTATVIVTNSKPSGPVDYFQVTFDDFIVEKPGKARKFCNVALDLKFPQGWSYSVMDIETDGYAEIQKGVRGKLKMEYAFRGTSARASKTRNQKGYWEGEYKFSDRFGQVVWSPCGKVLPVNLKTTIQLSGRAKNGEDSVMTVDQQSGLLTQLWGIRWKRC